MASKVDIINIALTFLGADNITSVTENSENARRMNVIYVTVRDSLLRGHLWNFATLRASLASVDETPPWGYTNVHQIPTASLRVIHSSISSQDYRIEGRKIYSDDSSMEIKYISRETDTQKYPEDFIEAFAMKLAARLAYAITSSRSLAKDANDLFKDKLREAKAADAQENTTDEIETSAFIQSRSS